MNAKNPQGIEGYRSPGRSKLRVVGRDVTRLLPRCRHCFHLLSLRYGRDVKAHPRCQAEHERALKAPAA